MCVYTYVSMLCIAERWASMRAVISNTQQITVGKEINQLDRGIPGAKLA